MSPDYVRRSFKTKPEYDWLSHQIGTEAIVRVQVSSHRHVDATVFTLLGFGRDFGEAQDMLATASELEKKKP